MGEYCDFVCGGRAVAGPIPCVGLSDSCECEVVYRGTKLIEPMPWIGLYAAFASLICTLGLVADTIHGFRSKKLWFPCKFFGLNAATLTLLAVATKLSVDLSTEMRGPEDQLSQLSSTIFLSTAMGNCLTSLGSMDNQSILMNVTALVIFVVTVLVNMSIQICNLSNYHLFYEFILATVVMFVLLIALVSSALSVPTTKKYIEAKYQEIDRIASNDQQDQRGKFTTEYLKYVVRKYWVMAATGNPQFVIARSATCTICGAICPLIALVLLAAVFQVHFIDSDPVETNSDYQASTFFILAFQSVGIVVGTVGPVLGWFTAVNFKFSESEKSIKSYKNELKIETYWTRKLKDWQESSLSLSIRGKKFRKLVHNTRYMCLTLCIKVQIAVVLASKCIVLSSICLLKLFSLLLSHIRITKVEPKFESSASTDQMGQESEPSQELNSYILLLEGEVGLPRRTLKKIFCEVDQLILTGKKKQSKFLIELLGKSRSYNGVTDFDSDQVPSLHSEEPPNCWSLPAATLVSIAIVIPNIQKDKSDRLLKGVGQGLRYACLIDKHQKTREDFVILSNAADVVWAGVELHGKWLDEDLGSFKGKTSREILEGFAKISESSITDFKTNKNGKLMKNPSNWPLKVIAACSMYRISRTLLLAYEGDNNLTDEDLFKKLSVMIADIFAACFVSLPRLIFMKCHCEVIEERETSVRQAALLLGESEEVLEILQQHDVPGVSPDQPAYVDEWRALMKERNPPASISSFTNEEAQRLSVEADVVNELES